MAFAPILGAVAIALSAITGAVGTAQAAGARNKNDKRQDELESRQDKLSEAARNLGHTGFGKYANTGEDTLGGPNVAAGTTQNLDTRQYRLEGDFNQPLGSVFSPKRRSGALGTSLLGR